MIGKLFQKIFGTKQERDIKKIEPIVDKVNEFYDKFDSLTEDELRAKTDEFRQRIKDGELIDDILPEAYAVVKQGCKRLVGQKWMVAGNEVEWDMIPFDVQIAGAIALHQGRISEMATGEGKTLVAIMPLYLNGLTGKGAHLITVNDYLAKRDSEWMGKVLQYLGLTVGCILTDMEPEIRREMYKCDVTYGTNNEFGFDYLRDNMVMTPAHLVQRGHNYAIVDEVDSVLIDEARTPLIISGAVDRSTHRYDKMKPLVAKLVGAQIMLINRLVSEAEKTLESEPNNYEAGIKLVQAKKGAPKHKKYTKLNQSPALQKLQNAVESDFIRDKRIHELEEELLYVIDEKGHTISLTEKGRHYLSPEDPDMFMLPDIVDEISKVENTDLPPVEKEKIKSDIREKHSVKAEELHNISQLLRAYSLFEKDVEYVVQDNKVIIVDEFTGRLMPGRRYSDGLHQALEAKEGVVIEKETQTLATITLQNYFRMYNKLAGMTGTAYTEAQEFNHTYKMDVVQVPTNRPVKRLDYDDVIYRTKREKYNMVVDQIIEYNKNRLPVLVGTVSVEVSELLSRMLQRSKISHSVLNAKHHEKEADIVKNAGLAGAVTIATNMAGRGTDIKLGWGVVKCLKCCINCDDPCDKSAECNGSLQKIMKNLSNEELNKPFNEIGKSIAQQAEKNGNDVFVNAAFLGRVAIDKKFEGADCLVMQKRKEQFKECSKECPCGLQIIGTERHEARRIDLQLRGRAGRQGDPGGSKFFLSLEDDLMRLFGSDRIISVMERMGGMEEGDTIQHPIITRGISSAQKKIEEINFGRRKHTLEYDDVMNKQRETIYGLRLEALVSQDPKAVMLDVCMNAIEIEFEKFTGESKDESDWDVPGFLVWLNKCIPFVDFSNLKWVAGSGADALFDEVGEKIEYAYELKKNVIGDELIKDLTRYVVLRTIDTDWQDHLLAIDDLQEGIHLRAYGQQDPLIEYKKEATRMFEEMLDNIYKEIFEHYFRIQVTVPAQKQTNVLKTEYKKEDASRALKPEEVAALKKAREYSVSGAEEESSEEVKMQPFRRETPKVGRNELCPCGSGKKFKKCCGKRTA